MTDEPQSRERFACIERYLTDAHQSLRFGNRGIAQMELEAAENLIGINGENALPPRLRAVLGMVRKRIRESCGGIE